MLSLPREWSHIDPWSTPEEEAGVALGRDSRGLALRGRETLFAGQTGLYKYLEDLEEQYV